MTTYWLMYIFPAWLANHYSGQRRQRQTALWVFVALAFIVLVGLRFHVGGDWNNYFRRFNRLLGLSLDEALQYGDSAYIYLSWLMGQWDLGISGVNLVAATIFITGLTIFCRQQPMPWLAFAVAVPYLVIVVGMGYTRQAIAIGLFMWAITYLERGELKYYLLLVASAAFFHKTAVLMIPLGIFLQSRSPINRVIAVGLVAYGVWDLLFAQYQDELWRNYVDANAQSQGAKIRVFMNLVPSLILMFYWRKWKEIFPNFWFWFWIGAASIIGFVLVGAAPTAVDRMSLYFIPIQIAVFSRLPFLAGKALSRQLIVAGVLLGYAAVLFVWLNYAANAHYWVPYHNTLFY